MPRARFCVFVSFVSFVANPRGKAGDGRCPVLVQSSEGERSLFLEVWFDAKWAFCFDGGFLFF